MAISIQIGPKASIENLQLAIAHLYTGISSHGRVRNKIL
jgi:hypothetical protein